MTNNIVDELRLCNLPDCDVMNPCLRHSAADAIEQLERERDDWIVKAHELVAEDWNASWEKVEQQQAEIEQGDWFSERIAEIFAPLVQDWRAATGKELTTPGYADLLQWERERLIEALSAAFDQYLRAERAEAEIKLAHAGTDAFTDALLKLETERDNLRAALRGALEYVRHDVTCNFPHDENYGCKCRLLELLENEVVAALKEGDA